MPNTNVCCPRLRPCRRTHTHTYTHTRVPWLASQAFAEGRFPPGVSSKDFVRLDDSQRHSSADGWAPEETML